ncbi:MAG: hypothetical protein HN411_03680 [Waddliaceae bacterium]|jgi:hypothetical protein|nr:hypothetical protein [Waddliaceae bacterium]MBT3579437.1 hypothetical protein [Waddliaceae bacterium]MBT4445190.1 hypothetical protein [Waddliaceae bacterium]MBT6928145.1 hypothetical protein [Waddliaceae bacterium]MBT7264478.1 hypothetical protein [Waddliaceae bacterium]
MSSDSRIIRLPSSPPVDTFDAVASQRLLQKMQTTMGPGLKTVMPRWYVDEFIERIHTMIRRDEREFINKSRRRWPNSLYRAVKDETGNIQVQVVARKKEDVIRTSSVRIRPSLTYDICPPTGEITLTETMHMRFSSKRYNGEEFEDIQAGFSLMRQLLEKHHELNVIAPEPWGEYNTTTRDDDEITRYEYQAQRGIPLVRYKTRGFLDIDPGFSLRERIKIVADVASALRIIHQKGIIHGDVKPYNIVAIEGTGKLIDHEFAAYVGRWREEGDFEDYFYWPKITNNFTGVRFTDIYGLAITMAELFLEARAYDREKRLISWLQKEFRKRKQKAAEKVRIPLKVDQMNTENKEAFLRMFEDLKEQLTLEEQASFLKVLLYGMVCDFVCEVVELDVKIYNEYSSFKKAHSEEGNKDKEFDDTMIREHQLLTEFYDRIVDMLSFSFPTPLHDIAE